MWQLLRKSLLLQAPLVALSPHLWPQSALLRWVPGLRAQWGRHALQSDSATRPCLPWLCVLQAPVPPHSGGCNRQTGLRSHTPGDDLLPLFGDRRRLIVTITSCPQDLGHLGICYGAAPAGAAPERGHLQPQKISARNFSSFGCSVNSEPASASGDLTVDKRH